MARLSPAQFNEWVAAYRLDPWGDDWDIGAMIAAKIHNTSCDQPITPAELIPNEDTRERYSREDTPQAFANTWKQRVARMNRGR